MPSCNPFIILTINSNMISSKKGQITASFVRADDNGEQVGRAKAWPENKPYIIIFPYGFAKIHLQCYFEKLFARIAASIDCVG